MGAFTDTFENKLIDHILRGQPLALGGATATFNQAPVLYIGLLSVLGNDAGGETELTGTGYARVAITANLTNFNNTQGNTTGASSGTDGTSENAVEVAFATPGSGGWGTANAFGIYEAASGGSPIIKAALTVPNQTISEGAVVKFAAGQLSVQVDN